MSDSATVTRLIAAAARECLEPLGLRRGKSRTWYDDQGWWIINVEFDRITPNNLGVGWEHDLARSASELSSLAADPDALRQRMHTPIKATRHRLKLSPGPIAAPAP